MNSKPKRRSGPRAGLVEHDTSITLRNHRLVFDTFMECLEEGDYQAAREVLAASLKYMNKSQLERRYHIPRRTAYNLMSKKSLPSLDLVAKVCHAIRQESLRK